MSKGKKQVGPQLDKEEQRRLHRFMDANGFKSEANGAKKAMLRGLESWERVHDPAHSWLLNIGIAALLWAMLAALGHIRIGTPPWDIAAFSVVMAFIFLTAHAVQVARYRWDIRLRSPRSVEQ